jgi:hypothetical protein
MHYDQVHTIGELPHTRLKDEDKVQFTDGALFEVENWHYDGLIWIYFLRRILKDGSKGKTHWVVTYTIKKGMKAKCHRIK